MCLGQTLLPALNVYLSFTIVKSFKLNSVVVISLLIFFCMYCYCSVLLLLCIVIVVCEVQEVSVYLLVARACQNSKGIMSFLIILNYSNCALLHNLLK